MKKSDDSANAYRDRLWEGSLTAVHVFAVFAKRLRGWARVLAAVQVLRV
jgi:hypothetical protein